MFHSDAKNILTLLGKDIAQSKGVITVPEMPAAIATLQMAIGKSQQALAAAAGEKHDRETGEVEPAKDHQIAFCRRAQPFLEMLKICLRDNKAITWGV